MFNKIVDRHYRRPTGLLGLFIGSQMARDHLEENLWTMSLLDAQQTDWILELGFGAGVAIQELALDVTQGHIAGVDFSKMMVALARRRNAKAIRSGLVDLHFGDVATLPFEDNRFDKVFSIHSIYFWPQPKKVLKEIFRVLKASGKLVLTVLPKEKWNTNGSDKSLGTPDCKPYSGSELSQMLSYAGFKNIQVDTDSIPENRSNYSVTGLK